MPSVIRASRLAVIDGNIILGRLGKIDDARLTRLKLNLCNWECFNGIFMKMMLKQFSKRES